MKYALFYRGFDLNHEFEVDFLQEALKYNTIIENNKIIFTSIKEVYEYIDETNIDLIIPNLRVLSQVDVYFELNRVFWIFKDRHPDKIGYTFSRDEVMYRYMKNLRLQVLNYYDKSYVYDVTREQVELMKYYVSQIAYGGPLEKDNILINLDILALTSRNNDIKSILAEDIVQRYEEFIYVTTRFLIDNNFEKSLNSINEWQHNINEQFTQIGQSNFHEVPEEFERSNKEIIYMLIKMTNIIFYFAIKHYIKQMKEDVEFYSEYKSLILKFVKSLPSQLSRELQELL